VNLQEALGGDGGPEDGQEQEGGSHLGGGGGENG
jgi:hypothetical protein